MSHRDYLIYTQWQRVSETVFEFVQYSVERDDYPRDIQSTIRVVIPIRGARAV